MKKNIFKFAFVAIAVAALSLSCQKEKDNDSAIQQTVMVSISADEYFVNDAATVTATLSKAQESPVTITLVPGSKTAQSYTEPIATSLVSVGTITIPAGATEGSATVSVNSAELPKGKYETQVMVSSCQGANMTSDNSANIVLLHGTSTVSLTYNAGFDEYGTTTFTVSMDMYSEEDCEITIGQLEYPGYSNIPAFAFAFDKKIVIEAGETEATGTVQIDLDGLTDSDFYVGAIQIKAVSDGKFEISEEDYYSAAGFNYTAPKKNNHFEATYMGQMTNSSGTVVEVFVVKGVGGYLDYMISSADAEETNSFIYPEIIAAENDYIAQRIGSRTLDQICYNDSEGYAIIQADKRAAGDYKFWVVAVSDKGKCTGEYNVIDFTVEQSAEPTAAYKAWLGEWTLGSTAEDDEPIVITISQKDANYTYYVDGLEGIETASQNMSVTAYFNEDGSISIYSQEIGTWEHSSYGTVTDVLAGNVYIGGKTYFVVDDTNPIATGVIDANGIATLSSGSYIDEEGTSYTITGMKYYGIVEAGAMSYTKINTPLPNTLIPVTATTTASVKGVKKQEGNVVDRFHVEHALKGTLVGDKPLK